MRSNAPARSASKTHRRLGLAPLATLKMAPIASWQPRPGRNPYDLGSNRASHSGSNAFTTRACNTLSRITGIPSGRRFPALPFLGIYTRLTGPWQARPVKRVYIPKKGSAGKRRPLGIPVILDRVLQARVVNALEPEWEARFEPRSYGFRPGRGCHDAIEAIFNVARGASPRRRWVLDADLAGAFDRIDHAYLLDQLGTFPARGLI